MECITTGRRAHGKHGTLTLTGQVSPRPHAPSSTSTLSLAASHMSCQCASAAPFHAVMPSAVRTSQPCLLPDDLRFRSGGRYPALLTGVQSSPRCWHPMCAPACDLTGSLPCRHRWGMCWRSRLASRCRGCAATPRRCQRRAARAAGGRGAAPAWRTTPPGGTCTCTCRLAQSPRCRPAPLPLPPPGRGPCSRGTSLRVVVGGCGTAPLPGGKVPFFYDVLDHHVQL